ncbi:MAG: LuxR C-terminal-related transcriptional regulator [Saprospiraceae bacterium]
MTNKSPHLTNREKEVLVEIVKGSTSKEIAEELEISTGTVESHKRNIMLKYDVNNMVSLVVKAIKWGVV